MAKVNYKSLILTLGLIAFSFLFVWYIFAWTEPTAVPPGGNVPAPLNVGPDAQTKEAGLILNIGGAPIGLIVADNGDPTKGYIGIGPMAMVPIQKLDVVGGYIRSDTGFCIDADCISTWPAGGAGYWTQSGSNLYANDTGWNVGIGTSTPSANTKLHVVSTGAGTAGLRVQGQSGSTWFPYTDGKNYIRGTTIIADTGGSVGIGTSGPGAALDVRSGGIRIAGSLAFTNSAGTLYADNWIGRYNDGSVNWLHIGGITTAGVRRIGLWANRTYFSGNVGIGTTSPGERLDVAGNLEVNSGFIGVGGHGASYMHVAHSNYKGAGQYALLQHGTLGHTYLNSVGTGDLYFRNDNATKMVILDNGNVGIGLTNPGVKLDVQGRISVRNPGGDTHILSQAGGVSTFFGENHARVIANGGTLWLDATSGINMGTIGNELRLGAARTHMMGFDGASNHWITAGGAGKEAIRLTNGTRNVGIGWDLSVGGAIYCAHGAAPDHVLDIAEYIGVRQQDRLEPGDVVIPDYESGEGQVRKASESYDTRVIGVISSEETAAMIIGDDGNGDSKLIALGGQVPTKATAEGGLIKPGDMLVTSSKPGFVMKADPDKVKPGMVVGKALTGLEKGEDKIIVFVGAN